VYVTTGAEVASAAPHDNGVDVVGINQRAKQVAQFCVGVEGQGVLALGAIEGDGGDTRGYFPQKMVRLVIGH